jgi:hypothetical protein
MNINKKQYETIFKGKKYIKLNMNDFHNIYTANEKFTYRIKAYSLIPKISATFTIFFYYD